MDEARIREYAKLMREEDLSGLEITEEGVTVRLERTLSQPAAIPVPAVPVPAAPAAAENKGSANEGNYVTSPMVGVVYVAPTEDSDPFVKVGDKVKAGDTLCIVEAMKLMNEIPAECDGVVAEICIQDAQVVEYGTRLFRIERQA